MELSSNCERNSLKLSTRGGRCAPAAHFRLSLPIPRLAAKEKSQMPIEFEVSSLEGVEESLRGAYEQSEGGKFRLNLDRFAETQKAPLLAKNKQLLDEKKKLSAAARVNQSAEDRIKDLESEVRHFKLVTPLRDMALKAGAMPDRIDVVMQDLEKRVTLDEAGEIVVLDRNGDPTDLTPEQFLAMRYRDERPYFFEASKAAGSGATQGQRSSGGSGGNRISR